MPVPVYDRSAATGYRELDRWEAGVGWLAHPGESGRRTSHAVRGEDGVWLLDPLDAPGIDGLLADLGEMAGVAVCSNWHARDAGAVARRHGVAVHLPAWMTRVEARVDAPVERYDGRLGASGFRVDRLDPFPGWREGLLYRERDGTLYTPDLLTRRWAVGDERVGLAPVARLFPPRDALPAGRIERLLSGHGAGVFDDAGTAVSAAFDGARRRLPRTVIAHGPAYVASILGAAVG